jgi:hypothetical protein
MAKEIEPTKEPEKPFRPITTTEADEPTSGDGLGPTPLCEDDGEPVGAIYKIFRQKLNGLRRLPRQLRDAELRAARDWLAIAMKDLGEKRAYKRQAIRMLRQQRRHQNPSLDRQ